MTSAPTRSLRRPVAALLGLIVLIVLPLGLPAFLLGVLNLAALAAIGAIALNMLVGVAGQFSVGSAAFMAIGGFTAVAFAVQEAQLPFVVVVLLATLGGGIAAVVVGVIALRVQGLYLVLATIAFHYLVAFGAREYQVRTAGPAGFVLPAPTVAGWVGDDDYAWYPVLVVSVVLVALLCRNIVRGRSGRAWTAVRDRDIAAAILGVDVARTKIQAFVVTSMIIGGQGALYAYYVGFVTYEAYTINLTVQYFAMIVIGGIGSITGSVIGAVVVTALPVLVREFLPSLPSWFPLSDQIAGNTFAVQSILFGVLVILFMRYAPRGLVSLLRPLRRVATEVVRDPARSIGGWRA